MDVDRIKDLSLEEASKILTSVFINYNEIKQGENRDIDVSLRKYVWENKLNHILDEFRKARGYDFINKIVTHLNEYNNPDTNISELTQYCKDYISFMSWQDECAAKRALKEFSS